MDENHRNFSAYDRLLQSPVNESRFDAENLIDQVKASDRSCWKGTILVIVAICALASVFMALAFLIHFPYPPTLYFEWNFAYKNCSGTPDAVVAGLTYCRTNPYPLTDLPYFVCSGDSVLVYNCTEYILSHNYTCPPPNHPTLHNRDQIHEQPYYLPTSLDANRAVSESACTLWEVDRQDTCFRLTDRFGTHAVYNITCVNGTSDMWPMLEPATKLGLFITSCVLYGIAVLTALFLFIVMLFARYSTWPDLERFVSEPALVEWSKHAYSQQEWDHFKEDEFGPNGKARVKYDLMWFAKKAALFVFASAVVVISIYCRVWIRSGTVPNSLIPGLSFFLSCLVIGVGTSFLMTIVWIISEPIVFEIKRRRNLEPLHFKITPLGYYWGQFFSVTNTCANSRRWEAIRMTGSAETQLCIEICTSIEGKHGRHNHTYKIPVPRSCIDSANQFILNFQAQGLHPANQFNASVWDS